LCFIKIFRRYNNRGSIDTSTGESIFERSQANLVLVACIIGINKRTTTLLT